MASLDATDIHSLPINPSLGNTDNTPNIILHQNERGDNTLEKITHSRENEIKNLVLGSNPNSMPSPLEQSTINSLVSGLQQASASGLTGLSSRDIPMNTNNITQDTQSTPNYIPHASNNNYIDNNTTPDDIINNNRRQQNKQQTMDVIYDEMQMPILLAILYNIISCNSSSPRLKKLDFRRIARLKSSSFNNKNFSIAIKSAIINNSSKSTLSLVIKGTLFFLSSLYKK